MRFLLQMFDSFLSDVISSNVLSDDGSLIFMIMHGYLEDMDMNENKMCTRGGHFMESAFYFCVNNEVYLRQHVKTI